MASLRNIKAVSRSSVDVTLRLSNDEFKSLGGYRENIHVISDNIAKSKIRISLRGKDNATKYLLIPPKMRYDLPLNRSVACCRIDTKKKIIFFYAIKKKKSLE